MSTHDEIVAQMEVYITENTKFTEKGILHDVWSELLCGKAHPRSQETIEASNDPL